MIKDEIIEETRRLRDEYAKQFDYDLRKIFEDLQKKQKESGRTYVSLSGKKDNAGKVKKVA
ncbi:MAG: hypothetical protein LH614_07215 [Pyrinomonadaceae bacterium]|nr:hypothetical protein [Pyrinomonadaceae bacterium]